MSHIKAPRLIQWVIVGVIVNRDFLVYYPRGISFIKLVNASNFVQSIFRNSGNSGPNNVVHMLIDNGSNYEAVGRFLFGKYPYISWSPYVAHCINLILDDIGEMSCIMALAN